MTISLVEIHAAGVNLLDSKIRDGDFKPLLRYRPPFILGHDVAGTVVRVGTKVRHFKSGDEIYARPRDGRVGTFAEFIAINEADAAPKPRNLVMEEAASIPLVGLTAWQVDRVFPFESTNEAMTYVEKGRAKGKVIVKLR